VVESLTLGALGRTPQIPDGWFTMFSWESRPARVPPDRWPPLGEVPARRDARRLRCDASRPTVLGSLTLGHRLGPHR
jgi:hypothetical protein